MIEDSNSRHSATDAIVKKLDDYYEVQLKGVIIRSLLIQVNDLKKGLEEKASISVVKQFEKQVGKY